MLSAYCIPGPLIGDGDTAESEVLALKSFYFSRRERMNKHMISYVIVSASKTGEDKEAEEAESDGGCHLPFGWVAEFSERWCC